MKRRVLKRMVLTLLGAQGATQGGGTYTIGPNDSLWGIARQMKPSDRVSIQQTMMAIQRLNPDAFIDGNINLLKRGAVLRAPSEQEAMELTNREAIALAAEQNRQWQQRLQGAAANEPRQIDLSGRSVSREQEPGGAAKEDRLQLVSGGASGSGDSAQGGTGVSGELRDQLAVAEENVDKFRRENEELKLRLNDLEDQLDTSEKVLTLKDEQIAALQAKLRELEAMVAAGHRAVLFFCVQHSGVVEARPADHIDPAYGAALRQAHRAGVEILAWQCQLSADEIRLHQPLPVVLEPVTPLGS